MAAWTELPPTGGLPECAALVQLAERLRWSAAELVVQYATRALAESAAEGGPLAVRAQALVAAALVRLGRHAEAVEPALAALRDAEQAGVPELVPAIRLDLTACAHGLGESLLGCTILRPVLENTAGRPSTRAIAITALVGCTAHVGRRDDLEDSLAEAERLLAADDALSPDARRMERAQLAMRTAAYYRRYGETEDAVDAARDGLGLLTKLRDSRLEGGLAKAGLTLELVCALLDDGELAEAERAAEPLLAEPVRSASAAAVGRLMLAMVTRVHVPAGRVERGRSLLGHAARIAERHEHDWLLADAHTTLAQLDEASGQPADALLALRTARVAEQRQLRRVDAAKRRLMIEFGARPMPLDTVNSLLRNVVRAPVAAAPAPGTPAVLPPARTPAAAEQDPADTDAATGLLTREGLSRRIQAVRGTNRPVALTLVRLDPVDREGRSGTGQDAPAARSSAPDALTTLAGRVRDIAPEDAELARSAGSELAVLLPHTTKDEAEEFAATIRESAIESDWLTEASGPEVSISTGFAQSGPATDEDADSLLTAARENLTTAEAERPAPTVPVPVPPSSDDLFLSTLEAAAGDTGAGYQEIRDLLAPLLGHPILKRSDPPTRPLPTRPDPNPPEPSRSPQPGDTALQPPLAPDPAQPHREQAAGTATEQSPEQSSEPDPLRWPGQPPHAATAPEQAPSAESEPVSTGASQPDADPWHSQRQEGTDTRPPQSPSPRSQPFSTRPLEPGSDRAEPASRGAAAEPGPPAQWKPHPLPASEPESDAWHSRLALRTATSPKADAAPSHSQPPDSTGTGPGEAQSTQSELAPGRSAEPAGMAAKGTEEADVGQLAGAATEPALSWRGEPLRRADPAPDSDGQPTLPLQRGEVARRHVVPEPDDVPEVPEVPRRSNIIMPKEPDGVPSPPEGPDGIPPEPGREPLPEVPPPSRIPDLPEPDLPEPEPELPQPDRPEPEPERPEPEQPEQAPPADLETALGPVQGPEPRPDDLPRRPDRSLRRPERSDTTSIAELLTEALVAYQETTDEDPEPVPEPTRPERMYFEHTDSRPSGRHRMPDWDNGV